MPLRLHYKHNCRDIQLPHEDDAAGGSTCLDDMAPNELFATLPVLTSIDPMFEPIPDEEMATA